MTHAKRVRLRKRTNRAKRIWRWASTKWIRTRLTHSRAAP